ncbi:hypothetical protein K474DRAFT_1689432 [Panus rudis PR-1116 ss-1]|nr:hypothetical protein K474DRAFT_1689432 [Panus rudis PR-1116 ss-1]
MNAPLFEDFDGEGDIVPAGLGDHTGNACTIICKIIKAYRPFTMSPVLLVSLSISQSPESSSKGSMTRIPSTAIVKLYDRRCFTNFRVDFDEGKPWTLDKEREYRQYLDSTSTSTSASPSPSRGSKSDFANPTYLWDNDVSDGEFEAYLDHVAQRTFTAERTTYDRLHELQGTKIPTLYGVVNYHSVIPDPRNDGATITDTIPGLLLEYIPSISLRELVTTWTVRDPPFPNSVLVALCEQAVKVVDRISDFEVLNEDVRVDNFLIRDTFLASSTSLVSTGTITSAAVGIRVMDDAVVLIDLGQCRLRRDDESEDEWVEAKWSQDETGAVGFVLRNLVRRFVGEGVWNYERSLRYYRPLEE